MSVPAANASPIGDARPAAELGLELGAGSGNTTLDEARNVVGGERNDELDVQLGNREHAAQLATHRQGGPMPAWVSGRGADEQLTIRSTVTTCLTKFRSVSNSAIFELTTNLNINPTEAKAACVWVYGEEVLSGRGIQVTTADPLPTAGSAPPSSVGYGRQLMSDCAAADMTTESGAWVNKQGSYADRRKELVRLLIEYWQTLEYTPKRILSLLGKKSTSGLVSDLKNNKYSANVTPKTYKAFVALGWQIIGPSPPPVGVTNGGCRWTAGQTLTIMSLVVNCGINGVALRPKEQAPLALINAMRAQDGMAPVTAEQLSTKVRSLKRDIKHEAGFCSPDHKDGGRGYDMVQTIIKPAKAAMKVARTSAAGDVGLARAASAPAAIGGGARAGLPFGALTPGALNVRANSS